MYLWDAEKNISFCKDTQKEWCLRPESNQRHSDFQSLALPTELLRQQWIYPFGGDFIVKFYRLVQYGFLSVCFQAKPLYFAGYERENSFYNIDPYRRCCAVYGAFVPFDDPVPYGARNSGLWPSGY